MHMADALLSPVVGGSLWAATATVTGVCSRRLRRTADERQIPLMGVLGAFVFAAQMINFTIPGTGSSGHLGGGLLLAILLGPCAAFLVLASVLSVQALFFADGGLLALGANIFNLGFFPCFIAYPLVYRPLAGSQPTRGRITLAAVLAAVVGLQFGSLGVVLETVTSGISEISLPSFLAVMQPIHLAIGVVEGFVTAAVVAFVGKAHPELLVGRTEARMSGSVRRTVGALGAAALLVGAGLSWFASANPDGLEWSLQRLTGSEELPERPGKIHESLGRLQERTALLPDYGFRNTAGAEPENGQAGWASEGAGQAASGVLGGALTLLFAFATGWLLRRRARAA